MNDSFSFIEVIAMVVLLPLPILIYSGFFTYCHKIRRRLSERGLIDYLRVFFLACTLWFQYYTSLVMSL